MAPQEEEMQVDEKYGVPYRSPLLRKENLWDGFNMRRFAPSHHSSAHSSASSSHSRGSHNSHATRVSRTTMSRQNSLDAATRDRHKMRPQQHFSAQPHPQPYNPPTLPSTSRGKATSNLPIKKSPPSIFPRATNVNAAVDLLQNIADYVDLETPANIDRVVREVKLHKGYIQNMIKNIRTQDVGDITPYITLQSLNNAVTGKLQRRLDHMGATPLSEPVEPIGRLDADISEVARNLYEAVQTNLRTERRLLNMAKFNRLPAVPPTGFTGSDTDLIPQGLPRTNSAEAALHNDTNTPLERTHTPLLR